MPVCVGVCVWQEDRNCSLQCLLRWRLIFASHYPKSKENGEKRLQQQQGGSLLFIDLCPFRAIFKHITYTIFKQNLTVSFNGPDKHREKVKSSYTVEKL